MRACPLRRFFTYRKRSTDRNGKENFPQNGTENFPLVISTFLCGQERKAVFYKMVRLSTTTKTLLLLRNLMSTKTCKKQMWVRKVYQERKLKGEFHLLINEMMLQDHFFAYFRMGPTKYEQIVAIVAHRIEKCSEKREPICPSER